MKGFLKNFRTVANRISKSNLLAILFLLAGISFAQPTNGQTETDPCAPSEYPFIGAPEATLCDQHGNLTCNVEVGFGTPITHSSQLGTTYTGNVCVKGDFRIDNNFKFINCVVKIDPGVTILVLPPPIPQVSRIFTIDNSKLFACDAMWNGIQLSNNTAISTKNFTVIEDALAAIKADNIQFSVLLIEKTTFNRNQIGILLMQDPSLPKAATIARFNTNKFLCTSPLNGTADQITFAGIKTVGVPFTINPTVEAFHNRFQGLQYGIVAEGVNTTISGRFFIFRNLRRDGIKVDEGSLVLRQTFWHNCEEKGVNIALAHKVDIRESCLMTLNTDIPAIAYPNYRGGVHIDAFGLSSSVNLNFGFSADLAGTTTPVKGIYLKGGSVGAGTKITVFQSGFSIHATGGSFGIHLQGAFPASSNTHIFANNFACSSPSSTIAYGIKCENGAKNNLNIYGNSFTHFSGANNGNGISIETSNGVGNYIGDNSFNANGGRFLSLLNNQNVTICSNDVTSIGPNGSTGFGFSGTNAGIDFTDNNIYATGVGVKITPGSVIGPQAHKGNKWFPVEFDAPCPPPFPGTCHWFVKASIHAQCETPDLASSSKFTVHTNQSIYNPAPPNPPYYDFFSEYYPEDIEPADPFYDFFGIDPTGTPSSACSIQLNDPNGGNGLDKAIADGLAPSPTGNPAMPWILKSYLYKKLKVNPSLVSNYAAYPTFLSSNTNTNIGRFYEVGKKIEEAFSASEAQYQQSQQVLDDMAALLGNLEAIDNQFEATTDEGTLTSLTQTKSNYLEQLRSLQSDYNALFDAHRLQMLSKLAEALALNQQIVPGAAFESNEKTFNDIYLQSMLYQSGALTESQIAELKSIGQQCTETGGLAVGMALGLLKECEKAELGICSTEPVDRAVPTAHTTSGGHGLMAPGSSGGGAWLYPNPAASAFYVQLPDEETGELTVADLTGKIIYRQAVNVAGALIEMDKQLTPGVYLVRLNTSKGTSLAEKLVVQSR